MSLHLRPLLLAQSARLVQDALSDFDLARVGQDRGLLQQTDVVLPHAHLLREDAGQLSDTSDVVRPHAVFELQRAAERRDHGVILVTRVYQIGLGALALGLQTTYG